MLNFGNKEFRNLQEQVLQNANELQEIKQSLGTALPNPIAGPQGPKGDSVVGPQGERGSIWTVGTDFPTSPREKDIHLKNSEVYQYTNGNWVLYGSIKGNQGVPGQRGLQGEVGPVGPVGPQGEPGSQAPIYKVYEKLANLEAFISKYGDAITLPSDYAVIFTESAEVWGKVGDNLAFLTNINGIVNVEANPEDIATTALNSIKIDDTVYYFDAGDIKYDGDSVARALNTIEEDQVKKIVYDPGTDTTSINSDLEVEDSITVNGVLHCESDIDMNNGTIEALEMSNNPNCAVNKQYVDKIKDNLDMVKAGLFETIWTNSTASFDRLTVATVNRTDDDKTIISNQYAGLKEIGAFSYVENQLVNPNNYSNKETNGITVVVNKETGVITLNGTCTGTTWCSMGNIPTLTNHKYLIVSSNETIKANINGTTVASGDYWKIIKPTTDNPTAYYSFYLGEGITYTNVSFTLKIVDLTIMGLDNITTIAEWEALGISIPSEYVAPHTVSSRPTTLKSYSEYASYTFTGNENWKLSSNGFFYVSLTPAIKPSANGDVIASGSFNGYTPTSRNGIVNEDNAFCIDTSGSLLVRDTSVETVADFKLKVAGKTIKYQPQNPTNAELLGTINLQLPTQFISAKEAKDIVKAVAKANGLYDLVHVSNANSQDLGLANWSYQSTHNRFYTTLFANIIQPNTNTTIAGNIICDEYNTVGLEYFANEDKVIAVYNSNVFVKNTQYTDPTALQQALNGVILQYGKTQPTETVIASNLTEEQLKFILQKGGSVALDGAGCDVKLDVVAIDYRE